MEKVEEGCSDKEQHMQHGQHGRTGDMREYIIAAPGPALSTSGTYDTEGNTWVFEAAGKELVCGPARTEQQGQGQKGILVPVRASDCVKGASGGPLRGY